MKKENDLSQKIEEIKKEIDDWVNEFTKSGNRVERFDLYEGNALALGLIAYKDDKNNINVLVSIHGQKPTNSVSFPVEALEDITEISKIVEKYGEVFSYVRKYETKTTSSRKRKSLLE